MADASLGTRPTEQSSRCCNAAVRESDDHDAGTDCSCEAPARTARNSVPSGAAHVRIARTARDFVCGSHGADERNEAHDAEQRGG